MLQKHVKKTTFLLEWKHGKCKKKIEIKETVGHTKIAIIYGVRVTVLGRVLIYHQINSFFMALRKRKEGENSMVAEWDGRKFSLNK